MEQVHVDRRSRSGRQYAEVGDTASHPDLSSSAAIALPWHGFLVAAMVVLAMALLGTGHKAIPANGTRRLKEAPT